MTRGVESELKQHYDRCVMKHQHTCEGSRAPFWVVHEILQRRHIQERLVIMLLNALKQWSLVPQTQENLDIMLLNVLKSLSPAPGHIYLSLCRRQQQGKHHVQLDNVSHRC